MEFLCEYFKGNVYIQTVKREIVSQIFYFVVFLYSHSIDVYCRSIHLSFSHRPLLSNPVLILQVKVRGVLDLFIFSVNNFAKYFFMPHPLIKRDYYYREVQDPVMYGCEIQIK